MPAAPSSADPAPKGPPPDEPAWDVRTVAVTAGRPSGPGSPLNVPPAFTSTYRDGGPITYGRVGNPTWHAFESTLGALEGGEAVAFSSGLAAVTAVLESLPPGARLLHPYDAYTGTRELILDLHGRGRLVAVPVDVTSTREVVAAMEGADALLVESPTNPLLGIVDLGAVLPAAAAMSIPTFVDNTFATPVLQRPLEYGATAVVHSASKYIGGHSDLLLGVVATADPEVAAGLRSHRSSRGSTPGTQETWLALRGLRTLPLRVERAQQNAAVLAARLAEHPAVLRVRYPGLPDHPGHALVGTQMRGPGAMIAFEMVDAHAADAVVSRLRLIVGATSLGGVETTIERRGRWAGEEHLPPGLLRMSVGIEEVEDLWRDLERSLA